MSYTCHITGYGPRSLNASQTSTLTPLSLKLTVLQLISFLMPYSSLSLLHCNFCNFKGHTSSHCPKYIAARSYTCTWHPASKHTVNNSHVSLDSQHITECAGTAPTFETSYLMQKLASSFNWNTDSGATSHMTPHRHWMHNYTPLHVPICLENDLIVYSAVGNTMGYPGVFQGNLHPYLLIPLPVNPWVFWSKQVQKHDFWIRNEGDITDLNKSAISHSVLIQKLCFWTRLKADRSGFHDPYPYPRLPVPMTRTGSKTRGISYSAGIGSVIFNPTIKGEKMCSVEFTRVLDVPDLKSNLLSILYLTCHKQFTIHINSDEVPMQQHIAIHCTDQWEQHCIPRRLYRGQSRSS